MASSRKVVLTRRMPSDAVAKLARGGAVEVVMHDSDDPMPRDALLASVPGAAAILCTLADRVDREVLDAAGPALRVISTMSVGYSHIDVPRCVLAGVRVGFTPDVLTEATADLALALTLATARRLPEAAHAVRAGEWSSWKPFWMTGRDVYGARVGIVGLGRIGTAIARRLRLGFNCHVTYTTRTRRSRDVEAELGVTWAPLETLLRESDIVILICALTEETRGLINRTTLGLMSHHGTLINVSRGEVVVQDDLVAHLESHPDFRAGLDVTTPEPLPVDHALLRLPNCYVLPHIGSASSSCRAAMAHLLVDNALAGLDGGDMPAEVPETRRGGRV